MKRFTNKQECLDWLVNNYESAPRAIYNHKRDWSYDFGLALTDSDIIEAFESKFTDLDSKQQLEQRVVESFGTVKVERDLAKGTRIDVNFNFDAVEKPKHYQFFDGVEAIELIAASMTKDQFYGYCLGNKLKYRLRAGEKDDLQQDINKSNKYEELYELHKGKCKRAIELNDTEMEW